MTRPRRGEQVHNRINPPLKGEASGVSVPESAQQSEQQVVLAKEISAGLGYDVIGPMCFCFANWLARKAKEAGISNLYFLSRDGWLLKRAFDLLPSAVTAGLTSHYLYSSRRAVWFASLKEDIPEAEFYEILSGASPYLPVKEYLLRIFIDPTDHQDKIQAVGFEDEDHEVITASDRSKLYQLFDALRPQIVANAAQERRDYLAYLKHCGVLDHSKSALVDVGWTGSILKYTRALVKDSGASTELYGYFFGVGANARKKYGFKKGKYLHGYLFDFDDKSHAEIRKYFFIIEKFLSPDAPSLIKMSRSDEDFKPVFAQGQTEASPRSAVVQEHALNFVKAQADAGSRTETEAFLPKLKKVLTDPDPNTAQLLSQYSYSFDFGYQCLPSSYAKTQSHTYYRRHPLQLFKDYRRAIWKPGYVALQTAPARVALKVVHRAGLEKLFNQMLNFTHKLF